MTSSSGCLVLMLSASIVGCSSAPPAIGAAPRVGEAHQTASGSARAPNAVDLAPPATSAAITPPKELATSSSASLSDPCLTARVGGTIGNCIAPSLFVTDSCETRRYVIQFDDCYSSNAIDTSALTLADTNVLSAFVEDTHPRAPRSARERVVAIRGRISGGHTELGGAEIDVDIDFVHEGAVVTKHLETVAMPRTFATNDQGRR